MAKKRSKTREIRPFSAAISIIMHRRARLEAVQAVYPIFRPKMSHLGAVMARFLLILSSDQRANISQNNQNNQKKLYHTTFFFTIPLPKRIKKVVNTTKLPVK